MYVPQYIVQWFNTTQEVNQTVFKKTVDVTYKNYSVFMSYHSRPLIIDIKLLFFLHDTLPMITLLIFFAVVFISTDMLYVLY